MWQRQWQGFASCFRACSTVPRSAFAYIKRIQSSLLHRCSVERGSCAKSMNEFCRPWWMCYPKRGECVLSHLGCLQHISFILYNTFVDLLRSTFLSKHSLIFLIPLHLIDQECCHCWRWIGRAGNCIKIARSVTLVVSGCCSVAMGAWLSFAAACLKFCFMYIHSSLCHTQRSRRPRVRCISHNILACNESCECLVSKYSPNMWIFAEPFWCNVERCRLMVQ